MTDEKGRRGRIWESIQFSRAGQPKFPEGRWEDTLAAWESDASPATLVRLEFKVGRTINLGDYESVRFDIGVELPGHVEEIDEMAEAAEKFIGPRFEKMVTQLRNNRGSLNTGEGRREFMESRLGDTEDDDGGAYY
jgi:hypothetical protein